MSESVVPWRDRQPGVYLRQILRLASLALRLPQTGTLVMISNAANWLLNSSGLHHGISLVGCCEMPVNLLLVASDFRTVTLASIN